jgi:DNA-binding NtrC family response regulator
MSATTSGTYSAVPSTDPTGEVQLVGYREARERAIQQFDVAYLTELMSRHEGNLSAAARAAGISRNYLRELLRKHDLYES